MPLAWAFGASEVLSTLGTSTQAYLGAGLGIVIGMTWPRIANCLMYLGMWI